MARDPKKDAQEQLERLFAALADDILRASDEEIIAEAAEETGDAQKEAARIEGLIARTVQTIAKSKLAAAKQAIGRPSSQLSQIVRLPLGRKQAILDRMAARDAGLREKLTLAARKGEGFTEHDLDAALEALLELGAIDEEGNPT